MALAFLARIGCGLAGGERPSYLVFIFHLVAEHPTIPVCRVDDGVPPTPPPGLQALISTALTATPPPTPCVAIPILRSSTFGKLRVSVDRPQNSYAFDE